LRFYVCSNGERKDVEVNTAIRNSQKASEDVAGELDDLKRKELVFDGGVSKLKAAFVGLFVLLELIDEVLANVAHEVLVNVLVAKPLSLVVARAAIHVRVEFNVVPVLLGHQY
jgi:hypothetical protein